MTATKLPYVVQPGSIPKIFDKVRQAQTPDRFTIDFLQTKLGFRGGNYRQFIPLAKKLGFLGTDGRPTDLYKGYRNPSTGGRAMATAVRAGYRELFARNEYAETLSREQLRGMVVEITGLTSKDRVVTLVCQTFESLKALADFEAKATATITESNHEDDPGNALTDTQVARPNGDLGLNLAYTINLVLPKSDDPAVFTAIFKSLREHLLRR